MVGWLDGWMVGNGLMRAWAGGYLERSCVFLYENTKEGSGLVHICTSDFARDELIIEKVRK